VRVVVDPSVSVIPGGAFADREELREVALPEGLVEIGPEAFRRCAALRSIRVPSSVVRIRRGAFARCESLAEAILADEGDGGGDGDGDDGGAPPPPRDMRRVLRQVPLSPGRRPAPPRA
jgi:hypothetical protein